MKRTFKLQVFSFFTFVFLALIVYACSGEHGESAMTKTQRMLSATWTLNKLTVDGTDQTALFSAMTLSVTAGAYTSQHGEPVWPGSGTWKLDDVKTITRDNGITVNIVTLNETTLALSLQWTRTTFGNGRANSISGRHIFEFRKN